MNKLTKVAFSALLLSSMSGLAHAKTITDIVGRSVDVPDNVKTMALGESRLVYSLAVLQDNPVKGVVAWRTDLMKNDVDTYKKLTAKFPEAKNITQLGDPYKSDVSIEKLITLDPDVYLLNLGKYQKAIETGLIKKLEKAGIPTVVIDFRQKPTMHSESSMNILGDLLNQQKRARKYNDFYTGKLIEISRRLSSVKQKDRPLVFIENAAGLFPDKCCKTYGDQNFGKFVELAGGVNWGSTVSKGFKLKVNPESIFTNNFDVVIGTGANWKHAYKGAENVSLGYDADSKQIDGEIKALAERKGWSQMKAVKNKRFYSIYHQFYNSPYHFMAIEAFAKWNHPELFKDVNLEENYKQFHKDFLPYDYSGKFWAKLK